MFDGRLERPQGEPAFVVSPSLKGRGDQIPNVHYVVLRNGHSARAAGAGTGGQGECLIPWCVVQGAGRRGNRRGITRRLLMFLNLLPVVFFIASITSVVYALLLARRMVTAVEQIARSTQRDVAD